MKTIKKKKYLDIDSALQRIRWRFGSGNFYPNEKDIEAYNAIANWVDNQRIIVLEDNQHFLKLFLWMLNWFAKYYETSPFNPFIVKEVSRILDAPVEHRYDELIDTMNTWFDCQIMEENGVEIKIPFLKTEGQLEEESKRIRDMISDRSRPILSRPWVSDDIRDEAQRMASEALNRFS